MNDSPMSLPPTPETKLRDGYKGTTGQPAFAIYERSKTNRNRGCARYTGFHYHISSYSKHGLLRGRPSLHNPKSRQEGAATEGHPYRLGLEPDACSHTSVSCSSPRKNQSQS